MIAHFPTDFIHTSTVCREFHTLLVHNGCEPLSLVTLCRSPEQTDHPTFRQEKYPCRYRPNSHSHKCDSDPSLFQLHALTQHRRLFGTPLDQSNQTHLFQQHLLILRRLLVVLLDFLHYIAPDLGAVLDHLAFQPYTDASYRLRYKLHPSELLPSRTKKAISYNHQHRFWLVTDYHNNTDELLHHLIDRCLLVHCYQLFRLYRMYYPLLPQSLPNVQGRS